MYYQPPPQVYYGPQYSGCFKLFLYGVALSFPLLGLIIGFAYMSRPDNESKTMGQTCLVVAIVSFVIGCCAASVFGLGWLGLIPFLEGFTYIQ